MRLNKNTSVLIDGLQVNWGQLINSKIASPKLSPEGSYILFTDNQKFALSFVLQGLKRAGSFGVSYLDNHNEKLVKALGEQGFDVLTDSEFKVVQDKNTKPTAKDSDSALGALNVLSSGTTGLPKVILHDWHTINTYRQVPTKSPQIWFSPYGIGTYAWYQMVAMGLFIENQMIYFSDNADPVTAFLNSLDAGVTAISSTPTFWRMVLAAIDDHRLANNNIDQISLGGEIVSQDILDALRKYFPDARIRHIYASSEAGASIVVKDGLAGFPLSTLNPESKSDIKVKIENGELFIKSEFSGKSVNRKDDWIETGDLVEISGDRVFFLGRKTLSFINVGGQKANVAEIRDIVSRIDGLLWFRVLPRKSPMSGNLVALEIVLDGVSTPDRVIHSIRAECEKTLPSHAVPRSIKVLEQIPVSKSLKG